MACGGDDPPATPAACSDAPDTVIAGLSRGRCFGSCPAYDIDVQKDGTLLYHGEAFVEQIGDRTGMIDAATVEQLQQSFLDAGFYGFADLYDDVQATDLPSLELRFVCDGQSKTVHVEGGDPSTPLAIPELAERFDVLVDIEQFIGPP